MSTVVLTNHGEANQTVEKCLRRAVDRGEASPAGGTVWQSDVRWHLPAEGVSSRPQPGSTITEVDGTVWTVLSVQEATLSSRWACVCRDLAVAERLDTMVTIQQATITKGVGGAAETTWASVATDVRARVQPLQTETLLDHGRREREVRARVILAADLAFDAGKEHRVIHNADAWRVYGYEASDRIDQLPALLVIRSDTPFV